MGRSLILAAAALLALALAGCSEPPPAARATADGQDVTARARAIHERVITIDSHDDIPLSFATEAADPGRRNPWQINIPKMEEGGLDAAFFVVYVAQTERTPENYAKARADAMTKFASIQRMVETYPARIALAQTADDVERIHKEGKRVALIGVENGYVIGKDLGLIRTYRELGARYLTLVHNGHNDIADSGSPKDEFGDGESEHGGVSEFGARVIEEMNRNGILVDVSHASKKTSLDAMKLSRAPVIASHSSARALRDVSRNMDDEQLVALGRNGGVIQIVALSYFVTDEPEKKYEILDQMADEFGLEGFNEAPKLAPEQRAEWDRRVAELDAKWPRATVADFVDHIDHAVKLIGIDHVGISSDFDGGGGVEGWDDASETLNVTIELVRRGYPEADIAKLWGGNTLRILREAERVAAEMQAEAGG